MPRTVLFTNDEQRDFHRCGSDLPPLEVRAAHQAGSDIEPARHVGDPTEARVRRCAWLGIRFDFPHLRALDWSAKRIGDANIEVVAWTAQMSSPTAVTMMGHAVRQPRALATSAMNIAE
jgi:hypothetical protein